MNIQELSDKYVKLQDMHIELQKEYLEMLTFITDKIIISKAEFELIKQKTTGLVNLICSIHLDDLEFVNMNRVAVTKKRVIELYSILAQVEDTGKGEESGNITEYPKGLEPTVECNLQ